MPGIYTRSGDRGETWAPLVGRVRKSHVCVEAVGALDEAESFTAFAEALAREEGEERAAEILRYVQEALFRIGFQLWRERFPGAKGDKPCIEAGEVSRVERLID